MDDFRGFLYGSFDLKSLLILLLIASISGFVIYRLLKWAPLSGGSGIPQIRGEIMGHLQMEEIPTIVSKIVGGGLGCLIGFSLGREGPSIQIGGASAKLLGRLMKRGPDEIKYMISAGAAAGLAAAFNAPIAGVIFTIEELHKGYSKYAVMPAFIASIIANYLSYRLMGDEIVFSFELSQSLPLGLLWVAILIGILTGFIGAFYNYLILKFQDFFKKISKVWLKYAILLSVAIIIGFTFFEITGGGHSLLEEIALARFSSIYILAILLGKLFYTTFCYGSGVQGGIFLPVLVIGGCCGALVYSLLVGRISIDGFFINFLILGMSGILASVVRSPLLSVILVSEMTSTFKHLIALSIVVIVSYYVAEAIKSEPIYDSLLDRQLANKN